MPTLFAVLRRCSKLIRSQRILRFALLLSAGLLAGVSPASGAKTCPTLSLAQRDSGRTMTLRPCERITIRLKQQFDGGYQWKATRRPAPSVLKLVSVRTVAPTPKGIVGGADTRVYVYRAVGKGQTALRLSESRSFERHSQIAKFTLAVRVK